MRFLTAASVAALLAAGLVPATASAHRDGLRHNYKHLYYQAKRQLGPRAPGRQIVARGIRVGSKVRAATKADIARSIRQLRRLLAPPPHYPAQLAVVASAPVQQPAQVLSRSYRPSGAGGSSNAYVNPNCESGGNPQARDPSGTYWGKYQFDRSTWVASGGSASSYGSASAQEQDRVAANVTYDAWPNC